MTTDICSLFWTSVMELLIWLRLPRSISCLESDDLTLSFEIMFFFCSDHLVFAKLPGGLPSFPGPSGLCCCPSPEDRGRGWAEHGDLGWTSPDHPSEGAQMTFQTRDQPESPQHPQGTSTLGTGRIDAFELWCWRRLLRVPWTARRSNQSFCRRSALGFL